jgi:hypothetical protein
MESKGFGSSKSDSWRELRLIERQMLKYSCKFTAGVVVLARKAAPFISGDQLERAM